MFNDFNFSNYYEKLQMEKNRLEDLVEIMLNAKLEEVSKDPGRFSSADQENLDCKIYSYWRIFNTLESLKYEVKTMDKDSDEYCDTMWDIDSLGELCAEEKFELEDALLNQIAPEGFVESLKKVSRQNYYMIGEDGVIKGTDYIDYIFDILYDELNKDAA